MRDLLLPEALDGHALEKEAEEGAQQACDYEGTDPVDGSSERWVGKEAVVEKENSDFDRGHHPDPGHLLDVDNLWSDKR